MRTMQLMCCSVSAACTAPACTRVLHMLSCLLPTTAACVPPQRFAAVIMRIREPKTTALIFASGKMVCTGAKSEQDSKLAAKKVCCSTCQAAAAPLCRTICVGLPGRKAVKVLIHQRQQRLLRHQWELAQGLSSQQRAQQQSTL